MSLSIRNFTLKRELDFGDILTSVAILVSVFALWLSWHNDSNLRIKEYADRIRRSTSVVTAKVERWRELSDRYFEDIQPAIVDASEKVAMTHETQPANRMLFKGLMDARAKASERVVNEQLQISYMEMYGYVPALQPVFDKTIGDIKRAEQESHEAVEESLQKMLRDPNVLSLTTSAEIGNKLRFKADDERKKLSARIQEITEPLRAKMLKLIQLNDEELADSSKRSTVTNFIASDGK